MTQPDLFETEEPTQSLSAMGGDSGLEYVTAEELQQRGYISLQEASEIVGVTRGRINQMVNEFKIPGWWWGNKIIVVRKEHIQTLKAQRAGAKVLRPYEGRRPYQRKETASTPEEAPGAQIPTED